MKIRYTNSAVDKLSSAIGWYEEQRKGFEFLDSVEVSVLNIQSNPELYPVI